MVGHRPLKPFILVRIQVPEPHKNPRAIEGFYITTIFDNIKAMSNSSPEQQKSLNDLLPYGKDLLSFCEQINLFPIAYGSLAYIFYANDKSTPINDIDFLIPKERFQDLLSLVSKYSDLRYEETTYNSIKVFRGDLKIAFDSIEDYLKDIDFKTEKADINGHSFTLVDKETLKEVYRRGAQTIPFKEEAYRLKLEKLT